MIVAHQFGDKVTKLITRTRETVQKQNRRSGAVTCLTIENVAVIYLHMIVLYHTITFLQITKIYYFVIVLCLYLRHSDGQKEQADYFFYHTFVFSRCKDTIFR